MNPRLRAIGDLAVAEMREYAGLHDLYDGAVQDLSPSGVAAGLARLGAEVARLALHGDADVAIGADALARLMGDSEAMAVDLGRLAERADRERDRLRELLHESCARFRPGAPTAELLRELQAD